MTNRVREGLFTAFLIACLAIGGASREGDLGNFALQVCGIGFLGWGFYRFDWAGLKAPERLLLGFGALGLLTLVAQFVPLSPEAWAQLPGRSAIAAELALLNALPDPGFVTLSFHDSLRSAMWLLPALGAGIALLAARTVPTVVVALALVGMALLSLFLGLLQVLGGAETDWYLYDFTNRGYMVGFFANANHMATLLLVSLPFLGALVRESRTRLPERKVELTLFGAAVFGLLAIGIGLVGSLTGYALLAPAALASVLIVWTPRKRLLGLLTVPALAFAALLLGIMGTGQNAFSPDANSSLAGREQIRMNAVPAAVDFFPVGSGLGTFEDVYRRYEDQERVTTTFINHAHNDYLELVIDLGALGLLLIAVFFAWWLYCLRCLWGVSASPFAWAGWVAIGILLTHSGWDYPLRTAALSTVFGICCVLVARMVPARDADRGASIT
ncbi:O-antigen ligase family protein [Porphyrobacter sp. AAP60]|uniref:O-antigen ligase family protein n=1 Tax=Porphyrobacter sp. AAP60 TaxID=1523423 RepID=UPI0006B994B2|nr:O-antigen ligase family protein [Porphyrobacter sp. AAP60]KPF63268.1 hypothetical protein IP79_10280 [Porphyrobacter sp. AAP60]